MWKENKTHIKVHYYIRIRGWCRHINGCDGLQQLIYNIAFFNTNVMLLSIDFPKVFDVITSKTDPIKIYLPSPKYGTRAVQAYVHWPITQQQESWRFCLCARHLHLEFPAADSANWAWKTIIHRETITKNAIICVYFKDTLSQVAKKISFAPSDGQHNRKKRRSREW